MDLIKDIQQYSIWVLPGIFFLVGVAGSLHCLGMCGGLAVFASGGKKSSWGYQLGRLFGYFVVGNLLAFFGQEVLKNILPNFSQYAWVLMALIFIYMGLSKIFPQTATIFKIPSFHIKSLTTLMGKARRVASPTRRAWLVGSLSALLPCGVLYIVLFSLLSLNNFLLGALCISAFWLGTLPAMHWGNLWFRSILNAFTKKLPRASNYALILIGFLILISRSPTWSQLPHPISSPIQTEAPRCH